MTDNTPKQWFIQNEGPKQWVLIAPDGHRVATGPDRGAMQSFADYKNGIKVYYRGLEEKIAWQRNEIRVLRACYDRLIEAVGSRICVDR